MFLDVMSAFPESGHLIMNSIAGAGGNPRLASFSK